MSLSDWKEHPLDLASNTQLRTLVFEANVMLPYVWGSLPTIPEMLSTVMSPHLSSLSIHLANLDEEPVPSTCLSTIDDILERPLFRSLSSVKLYANIHAKPGNGREQVVERTHNAVNSAMPKLLQRGVLYLGPSDS